MHLETMDGVQWYLSDAAPPRTGSCAPSEANDASSSLDAFYDVLLPLYDREGVRLPRPGSPKPPPRDSTMPAWAREVWPSAKAISRQLRGERSCLQPPTVGQRGSPLSTIYSVRQRASSASMASAPMLLSTQERVSEAASLRSAPSLHKGLTAPVDYAWPAYLGDDGRPRLKGSVHAAAKGQRKADLQQLIIDQPLRLAEREISSGRTPLACAVRKQRFKEAEMILSAMRAYGYSANNAINYVGYDGRNALMLVMDASIHHLAALALFDALLQAGANPLWRCPVMRAPPLWGLRHPAHHHDVPSEHAAQYAVRRGKSLWLNKLLRWDETQRRIGKTQGYLFDVGALRTQATACQTDTSAELGRVLWSAERRRLGQGLRRAYGVSLGLAPRDDVAVTPEAAVT